MRPMYFGSVRPVQFEAPRLLNAFETEMTAYKAAEMATENCGQGVVPFQIPEAVVDIFEQDGTVEQAKEAALKALETPECKLRSYMAIDDDEGDQATLHQEITQRLLPDFKGIISEDPELRQKEKKMMSDYVVELYVQLIEPYKKRFDDSEYITIPKFYVPGNKLLMKIFGDMKKFGDRFLEQDRHVQCGTC